MLIALNDTNLTCQGKRFDRCIVSYRGNYTLLPDGKTRVSLLKNPTFFRTQRGKVLCYCDEPIDPRWSKSKAKLFRKLEDICLKDRDQWFHYPQTQQHALSEASDAYYESDKRKWAFANIESPKEYRRTMAAAIRRGYPCDQEYLNIRAEEDFPGFREVSHRTFFYRLQCPSQYGLDIERFYINAVKRNRHDVKHNTYTTLALLQEVDGEEVDKEILLIFNFLGRADLYAVVKDISNDDLPLPTELEEECQMSIQNFDDADIALLTG